MPNKSTKQKTLSPSTLETVDFALYNWLNEKLDIYTDSNEGRRKVPIIWITAERAFQVKDNKELREIDSQSIIYPAMVVERTSVSKTNANERVIPGNIFPQMDRKRGAFPLYRRVVKDKTQNFQNAEAKRYTNQNQETFKLPFESNAVVYETLYTGYPVFLNMNYTIKIRTDYIQQLNEVLLPFQRFTGGINQFLVEYENHKFEAFIEDDYTISSNASNLGGEEKKFDAQIKIRVLGYITADGINQDTPFVVSRESPAKIRFTRERVMLGEKNSNNDDGFFRQ
tara:strand:+ start:3338 stop:4186 length:849 start_codon:yes stop_codon:yes gene_type:complete